MENIDKEISKYNLEAYGWSLREFNHSTPFSSNFIYFMDWRSKSSRIFCVSQDDFNKTKISTSLSLNHVVAKLECILNKFAHGKALTPVENNEFVPLLINYIKQTRSYTLWRQQSTTDMRLHMLINIYRDVKAGGTKVMLRPFIINPETIMLTPDEVSEFTSQVKVIDQQNHPDWFR